jgi:hypothetical protein
MHAQALKCSAERHLAVYLLTAKLQMLAAGQQGWEARDRRHDIDDPHEFP